MIERPKRILVAEDNQPMLIVLRYNLERVGFQVTAVRSGQEAWQQLQDQTFDLLLTDYQMPELSGLELCQLIRSQPHHDRMSIFMVTAKRYELDTEEILRQLRVELVLPKPFSPVSLVKLIQQHLGTAPSDGQICQELSAESETCEAG